MEGVVRGSGRAGTRPVNRPDPVLARLEHWHTTPHNYNSGRLLGRSKWLWENKKKRRRPEWVTPYAVKLMSQKLRSAQNLFPGVVRYLVDIGCLFRARPSLLTTLRTALFFFFLTNSTMELSRQPRVTTDPTFTASITRKPRRPTLARRLERLGRCSSETSEMGQRMVSHSAIQTQIRFLIPYSVVSGLTVGRCDL